MSVRRKEIRNAVQNIIKGQVKAVKTVRAQRSDVYELNELPAVAIYSRGEVLTEHSQAPRTMRRELDLAIEVLVYDEDDRRAADFLDTICEDIECALTKDDSLGCRASDIILQRIDFEFLGENVETSIHAATMVWGVRYFDDFPRTRIDQGVTPAEGVDVDWQLEPATDPEPEAEDTIELPQV